MVCKICGAEVEDNGNFCPECGAKLERQICCKKCGTLLPIEARFCPECGEKFDVKMSNVNPNTKNDLTAEQLDEIYKIVGESICEWQEINHRVLSKKEYDEQYASLYEFAKNFVLNGGLDD